MIKMIAIYDSKEHDITCCTGNYKRSDNVDSLGQEMTFDLVDNPLDANMKQLAPPIGAKILVSNNNTTIFQGIVISYDRNSLMNYGFKCYDYAYYLNKTEAVIQFNDNTVTEAIQKLCSQQNIPVGNICSIPTKVTKIFNGNKVSDIIKELLKMGADETGKKYRLEVDNGKLIIEERNKLVIEAEYKPTPKEKFNPCEFVGGFSSSYSVNEMCNRVVIVSSQEKNTQVYAEATDNKSIDTYGQITHYEKIDDKKSAEARNIASKKLKELNKVNRTFKVTMFGDDKVRSGRCLKFNQPDINLVGTYLVKNCTHTYNGRNHFMECELDMESGDA
jgi:hypothetical protein